MEYLYGHIYKYIHIKIKNMLTLCADRGIICGLLGKNIT